MNKQDLFLGHQYDHFRALNYAFQDLYEAGILEVMLTQKMFSSALERDVRELPLTPVQQYILRSHGLWSLKDVMVLGCQFEQFDYAKAKKALSQLKGVGPRTIEILMQEIFLASSLKGSLCCQVREIYQENKDPEMDKLYIRRWAQKLKLQYEEVKQAVKALRREETRLHLKKL
jgi:hypothetical protein